MIIAVKMRNVVLCTAGAALLVALTVGVGITSAAGIWAGRPPRRLPVYSVQTDERLAALTFDVCGPRGDIGRITEILQESGTPATFFVTGFWAEGNSETLRGLSQAGHEIGTHGNTHINMARLSSGIIGLELEVSARAISGVTGVRPELFRPPDGGYSDNLITVAEQLGFMTLMGDIDAGAAGGSPEQIAVNVLSRIGKGSIIILKSDSAAAVASLPLIIEGARNMGFGFVSAGKLAGLSGADTV